jgi:glycosyltransferase involved in cell wall biosynthesis
MIYDYVFELPSWSPYSGGIVSTVAVANALRTRGHRVGVWFQKPGTDALPESVPTLLSFPKCGWAITYSDTPTITRLLSSRRAENVAVYMLSYGMAPAREKFNAVLCPGIRVWTSTLRTQFLIQSDGGKPTHIGCGHDWENFFPVPVWPSERVPTAATMYHGSDKKRYNFAVDVCDTLYKLKKIERVLVFGGGRQETAIRMPIAPCNSIQMADRALLRGIFSNASVYIMPSVSEGCNKTPAEATLCGCASVLCDGALGELYDDGRTCLLARPDDLDHFVQQAQIILEEPDCGALYRKNIQDIVKTWTFENVAKRIEEETCNK